MYICIFQFTNVNLIFVCNIQFTNVIIMAKRKNDKTHSITIDNDLWALAGAELGNKRSKTIENFLMELLNTNNDIKQLEQEIAELEQELLAKKSKLEQLKQIEQKNNANEEIFAKAMESVNRIVNTHNFISKKQIGFISNREGISEKKLTNKIREKGIEISNFDAL